ncbi:hypothetical protein [Desulfoplanes formicivorans]|nr:hypothetical protein [Desulfoplanes formicivorans]
MDTYDPQKCECPLCGCLYSWALKKLNKEKIKNNKKLFAQRSIYQSRRLNQKNKKNHIGILIGFLVLIIFVGLCMSIISVAKQDLMTSAKLNMSIPVVTTSLKRVDFPDNGYVLYSSEMAVAPFTFEANNNENNVIMLFDVDTGKRIFQAFVNAGTTFKSKIPLGAYRMVIVHGGKNWYGFEKKFGDNTKYSKATKMLEFYKQDGRIMGNIVKMSAVNGNFKLEKTEPVDII